MREKVRQKAPQPYPAGTPAVPAIELRSLCKSFGTLHALDHLTLSVEQGEIFGLLGPNGSGKTTTINLISGLSTPTSCEVQVMGYDVRRHARRIRQMLGAVPQETALYEELSAWDNLDFHADLFGMAHEGKKARIMQMLELVQLQDRKRSRVSIFSGGMKHRLALARCCMIRSYSTSTSPPWRGCAIAPGHLGLHPLAARSGQDGPDHHQLPGRGALSLQPPGKCCIIQR